MPDVESGFTVIFVAGPIERGVLVRSAHADRELNMWAFMQAALELLASCISAARERDTPLPPPPPAAITAVEDRYGGVELKVTSASAGRVAVELRALVATFAQAGKRGLWLKIPLTCAASVGAAVANGFVFHHAQPDYVLLTKWLPTDEPSPLPKYAFTQSETSPQSNPPGGFAGPSGQSGTGDQQPRPTVCGATGPTGLPTDLT